MKSLSKTRYTLIGKLHDARDAEAWSQFTAIYQPVIFRFCRAKGLQHADATDVTQEVLAKISAAIENFDLSREKKNFRGWLYRITRNLVVDFIRKRDKDPLVQFDAGLELATSLSPNVDESAEFQRTFERQVFLLVSQKIRHHVKPETWEAFWETEVNRKPVADAARDLGMSTGAVYVARSRILARFKSEVEQALEGTCEHFAGEQDKGKHS